MATIPSTGVNLATHVRDVLNAAGGSVSNDIASFFKEAAGINQWALYKPIVVANTVTRLTLAQIKAAKCGMTPQQNTAIQKACVNYQGTQVASDVAAAVAGQKMWTYALPTGGAAAPMRLSDFTNPAGGSAAGYNTAAISPDKNWGGMPFLKTTMQGWVNTNIKITGNATNYDWYTDVECGYWTNLEMKIGEESWAGIGSTGGIEIPITYITGDGLISGESWRLGIAIYIPNLSGTGKWQLIVSRYPLKSNSTNPAVAKMLPAFATNTLAVRQMVESGSTSFTCIPVLVKNAKIGLSAYSSAVNNSYVILGTDSVVYSVPSGQGALTLTLTAESVPSVDGLTTIAYSPNKKWILARRQLSTAGSGSTSKPVYGIALVCTSAITAATYVSVTFKYNYLTSVTATGATTATKTVSETIAAGTTSIVGGLSVNGKLLVSGIAASVDTSSISWTAP